VSDVPVPGPIGPRCRFEAGDRVQLHGFPGYPAGQRRDGFRGKVLGGFGALELWVLTDDGRYLAERAAWLVPDGEREQTDLQCTCCPPLPPKRSPTKRSTRAQLVARAELEALVAELLSRPTVAEAGGTRPHLESPLNDRSRAA
jgi:hypothetical protein